MTFLRWDEAEHVRKMRQVSSECGEPCGRMRLKYGGKCSRVLSEYGEPCDVQLEYGRKCSGMRI